MGTTDLPSAEAVNAAINSGWVDDSDEWLSVRRFDSAAATAAVLALLSGTLEPLDKDTQHDPSLPNRITT